MRWEWEAPVPWELPDANSRIHWSKRARLTKDARQGFRLIARSKRTEMRAPLAAERRRLQLTLYRGSSSKGRLLPLLDRAQCMAKLKPIVDALSVRAGGAGWIVDDSEKWCDELMPKQVQCHGLQRVGVCVELDE